MIAFQTRARQAYRANGKIIAMVVFLSVTAQAADLLSLRPAEDNFKQAYRGMLAELDGQVSVHDHAFDERMTVVELDHLLQEIQPKMVILQEGKSVALWETYQKLKGSTKLPPALIYMTSYANKRIKTLENTVAITYEIQGVHSLCSVRSVVKGPINRIGVLYSTNLREFFKEQQSMAQTEGFELVGIMIDEKGRKLDKTIARSLRKLFKEQNVDALWILNDNTILKDTHLEWAWLPQIKRHKKPVVVSLERLVSSLEVGHFAVVPDHFEMGTQAARTILDIRDDQWSVEHIAPIRAPYSSHKKLHSGHLPKGIQIDQGIVMEEWEDFAAL